MKNILISGSHGQIGRSLISLLTLKNNVWIFDRNSMTPITLINDGGDPVTPKSFDLVIHSAGVSPYMDPNATEYINGNIVFTKKLLDSLNGLEIERFLYLSAVSVYKQSGITSFSEDCEIEPRSLYGLSKYLAEKLVIDCFENKAVILRLPGVVDSKYIWLTKIIGSVFNKAQFDLYNKNGLFNNCISVIDIYSFCCFMMNNPNVAGIYNMGANSPIKIEDVVTIIEKEIGCPATFREIKTNKSAFIDISKLNSVGFNSRTTNDMLLEACKNFLLVDESYVNS